MEPVIRGNYALNEGIPPNLNIGFLSSEPEGSEDITFYVPDQFWAASLSPIKDARTVKTPQLSLSKYLATLRPTFLIMDIEGGEIDIVDALDPKGLRKIAMELHPSVTGQAAIDTMVAKLESLGFTRKWMSSSAEHMYFEAS